MKTSAYLAAIVLVAVATGNVSATEFNQLRADASAVTFVFKQMNVPVEGQFKRIKGLIGFNPAQPAAARAEIEIELAGIDAGSPEANDELAGRLWFNTKAYPVARFVVALIKPLGNNRFDVTGKMSIKGKTLDVSFPATFRQEGTSAVFEGSFILKRADYAIGEGLWADFGTVANEIQLKFRLVAVTAGKK